eukprot:PhF_6_TR37637/c0_g1_i1/m.55996
MSNFFRDLIDVGVEEHSSGDNKDAAILSKLSREEILTHAVKLQEQFDTLRQETANLRQEYDVFKRQTRENSSSMNKAEVVRLQQRIKELQEEKKKELDDLKDAFAQYKQAATSQEVILNAGGADEQSAEAKRMLEDARWSALEAQRALSGVKAECDQLKRTVETLNTQVTNLKAELAECQEARKRESAESAQLLESETSRLRELNQSIQSKLDVTLAELEQVKASVGSNEKSQTKEWEAMASKVSQLERQANAAETSKKEAQGQLQAYQELIQELRNELDQKGESDEALRRECDSLAQCHQESKHQLTTLTRTLQKREEELAQHERTRQTMRQSIRQHEDTIQALRAAADVNTDALRAKTEENETLRAELMNAEERVSGLSLSMDQRLEEIKSLRESSRKLEAEISVLRRQSQDVDMKASHALRQKESQATALRQAERRVKELMDEKQTALSSNPSSSHLGGAFGGGMSWSEHVQRLATTYHITYSQLRVVVVIVVVALLLLGMYHSFRSAALHGDIADQNIDKQKELDSCRDLLSTTKKAMEAMIVSCKK